MNIFGVREKTEKNVRGRGSARIILHKRSARQSQRLRRLLFEIFYILSVTKK